MEQEELKKQLDEFVSKMHLPTIECPKEIDVVIGITKNDIMNLSREKLAEYGIVLAQYSLYIQRQRNIINGKIAWCDAQINSIFGRELSNVQGYGFQEKSLKILRSDINASRLNEAKTLLNIKAIQIEDIDKKIDYLSKSINNLSYVKGH